MNKKNVNKFHLCGSVALTALTSARSITTFDASCSSVSIGRCSGMSMNSVGPEQNIIDTAISEWRKHLCAWCSHKGPIFQTFTVSSWTTGQLDKLIAKVTEIWKYMLYVCYFNSEIILL